MITIEIKMKSTKETFEDLESFLSHATISAQASSYNWDDMLKTGLEKGFVFDMIKEAFDKERQTFSIYLFSENTEYANAFVEQVYVHPEKSNTEDAAKDFGIEYTIDVYDAPAFLARNSRKITEMV